MLALLFPQRCVICHRPGNQLCATCRIALPGIPRPWCERCGSPTAWPVRRCGECAGRRLAFASARAAVVYDDRVRLLVRAWKERGLRNLARTAADVVADRVSRPQVETLAFVPADGDRSIARGHHPAEQLAQALGGRWQLPVHTLLRRTGAGRRQTGLPLAARRANLRGAFAPVHAVGGAVCLVDDVYTSGATAHEAASVLRKGGARSVEVVTFARAVR